MSVWLPEHVARTLIFGLLIIRHNLSFYFNLCIHTKVEMTKSRNVLVGYHNVIFSSVNIYKNIMETETLHETLYFVIESNNLYSKSNVEILFYYRVNIYLKEYYWQANESGMIITKGLYGFRSRI